MFGDWSHMGGDWAAFQAHMLLFWVVLILVIVLLIRLATGKRTSWDQPREKSALDILKERYARGEIDKEEFEQKKRDLKD